MTNRLGQWTARAAWGTCVLLLLIAATLITFNHVIRTDIGDLGGMYDIYRYYAPLTFLIDHRIHAGEFPLWNPLSYSGLPITGNPQSFLFYPPNLIRALLTPEPTPERSNITLALMWGVHLVVMAFGTYLLARAHRLGRAGAMTAAIAFAFSALAVRRMGEYHLITTMAWLPILLLLIKLLIDSRDIHARLSYGVAAGFVFGLSILGGFLQVVNLMALVAGLYGLIYFLSHPAHWGPGTTWRSWLRPAAENTAAMLLLFGLGSFLAMVVLAPAWELASFTGRTDGAPINKYSDLWSWSPLDFYQKLVVYAGMSYEAETIRNSGVTALVLAAVGVIHRNRRDALLFLGLYIFLFECSFGPPAPFGSLVEFITPFSLSAYSRAYDFALLPLSLLAGFGVDTLFDARKQGGRGWAAVMIVVFVGVICLVPLREWITEITYIKVHPAVVWIPTAAVGLMLCARLLSAWPWTRATGAALLLTLAFAETAAWNAEFVPYLTKRKVRELTEIQRGEIDIPTNNFRENDPICNRFQYSLRFAMNGLDPLHLTAARAVLSGPPRDAHDFRGVQNWEPTRANIRGNLAFKRSFWLARYYAVGPLPDKQTPFPAATTVFLDRELDAPIPRMFPDAVPRTSISDEYTEMEITEPSVLFEPFPANHRRAYSFNLSLPDRIPGERPGSAGAVHSTLLYTFTGSTRAQIDTWIEWPGTDSSEHGLRHQVRPGRAGEFTLETPLPDFPEMKVQITVDNTGNGDLRLTRVAVRSDAKDEDGLIRIAERGMNDVDLVVGPLDEHRILTFLDADYPGWRAFVNDEEVPILRANEAFKAIVLPPGMHHVTFRFEHDLTYRAVAVSLGAAALGLILLCVFQLLRLLHRRAGKRAARRSAAMGPDAAGSPFETP